jgi:hypothetical protein
VEDGDVEFAAAARADRDPLLAASLTRRKLCLAPPQLADWIEGES